jgi:hypothetical protein
MQTLVRDVEAAWREAERIAATAKPGSQAYVTAMDAAVQLHGLYLHLKASSPPDTDVEHYRDVLATMRAALSGRP